MLFCLERSLSCYRGPGARTPVYSIKACTMAYYSVNFCVLKQFVDETISLVRQASAFGERYWKSE